MLDDRTAGLPGAVGGPTVAPRTGRALDLVLTDRLADAALDVLADEGYDQLTFGSLAARERAGKAAIYRRWPSVPELVADALARVRLVTVPEDHGDLREDLFALLESWTKPLDRDHRAAAELFSAARHSAEIRQALTTGVVEPLAQAVSTLFDRERARGREASPRRARTVAKLVQTLWWSSGVREDPLTRHQLRAVIDGVLLAGG